MAETDQPGTSASATIWRRLAERAIGGNLDTLESRDSDGLTIAPLYARVHDDPRQPWRAHAAWTVGQRVDHPKPETANRLALLDLEGGADALVLLSAQSPYARGFGLDVTPRILDLLFDKVELDLIGLRIDAGADTTQALAALTETIAERRLTSAALPVDVGFDPIGHGARLGVVVDADARPILDLISKAGLAGTAFLADGRPWHEAGASEAQELAAVLATAVAYLRRQEALGLTLGVARTNISFLLAADADVALGLAKFRAIRRLWARIESASGLAPRPVRLQAETSWRMMTARDPWTNAMRTTAATFAAGLGGADAITVLPFTLPLGLPDAGARRLARNTQRILLDEAHLGLVEDPAAGAGGFEALTDGLGLRAWGLFQDIEREGGIARAVATGWLKGQIAKTARARAEDIACLKRGIIGTSRYASLEPSGIDVLDIAARPALERGPDALPAGRDAIPFEVLRDRAEQLSPRPSVFLATLGTPAAFGPRAADAANFFAAAGFAASGGFESRDLVALLESYATSGSPVACICGSDAAYAAEAAATAADLRRIGARRIYIIGRSDHAEPDGWAAGLDAIICDGCDALHILGDALDLASKPRATL